MPDIEIIQKLRFCEPKRAKGVMFFRFSQRVTPNMTKKINQKLVKNDGFDQNGGRHELRHKKMMHSYIGDADFRAMATKIIKN